MANIQVSVISKLCILGMLKFSTLDPYGMGIEMEGGKPGWNDAMNGLPGNTTSSPCLLVPSENILLNVRW